jgi:ABC-type uncharacterized transport system involved in gliding motility auxiliary subunit
MTQRIFNIVGWLGTLMVAGAVAVRVNLIPLDPNVWAARFAWTGLVLMAVYLASQWREIVEVFSGRQARYGTLASVGVLVVFGILVAVNYIGVRQNKRWDLTENKQHSLSDQTVNVLQKLDAPLEITVFARDVDFPQFQDRLREYASASRQVKTQYIDPDKQQALARQNDFQPTDVIVLTHKGRTERVTQNTEQDLTNGIIKAVSGEQRKVYFTSGHGEKDSASGERDGFGTVVEGLKRENYAVEPLVLAQAGAVPDDASLLVVAGPKSDFFPPEVEALKKYLEKQGKVLLLIDPPTAVTAPQPTELLKLAHDWGIDVGNDIVVDASGMGRLIGTDASVPVAASYGSHAITDRFALLTAYPLARSVMPVEGGVNGRNGQSFVMSGERSWAESDIASVLARGEVSLDPTKGDKSGPVSLAAAVSVTAQATEPAKPEDAGKPKAETRLVVVGDSDFGSNAALGVQGNRDLFMNVVGWLSQQENLISIRPRDPSDRRITLTATQHAWINWIALLFVPAAVFGTGILAWMRRR